MTCEQEVVHGESCEIQKRFHCYVGGWGSVAEWPGRRTGNPEVADSSPALTTKLELSAFAGYLSDI